MPQELYRRFVSTVLTCPTVIDRRYSVLQIAERILIALQFEDRQSCGARGTPVAFGIVTHVQTSTGLRVESDEDARRKISDRLVRTQFARMKILAKNCEMPRCSE